MNDEMCRHCGGHDGAHGLVHLRYGNGGGGNQRCPSSDDWLMKRTAWLMKRAAWLPAVPASADSADGDDCG